MLRIAICDDNQADLLNVEKIINSFKCMHPETELMHDVFTTGLDLVDAIETNISYDIILLDVIMPGLNGIEIAQEIRRKNNAVKIIFLTSTPEFAVNSYEVDAFYYAIKPITAHVLLPILEKAFSNIFNKGKNILLKTKIGVTKVLLNNLEYLEIIGRMVYYHLKNGELVECTGIMSVLEDELLFYKQFIKPHRSFIVNMNFIDTISVNEIKTFCGARIPISRANYQKVKKQYIDYCFDGGLQS
ncbi:MAG: response regulator transcription factor [Hyphomonadaceae bacterium]|nr:response regulator transcription factor [Clostridia bacterium]